MASKPTEIVGQILAIPVDAIVVGDRLRPIDPVWAAALGKVMSAEQQNSPIEICKLPGHRDFLLITGGHRLEGARLEGWETIKAIIVNANAMTRRMREVSENLWRKGLDPIDRASFIAELIRLKKAKAGLEPEQSGQSIAARVRWNDSLKADTENASRTMRLAYGWADDVAEQIGLSRQTIYRDLELHRGLRPDLVEQLRKLPIGSNAAQLRALSKLCEADQRQVLALISAGTARGVADAKRVINRAVAPSPETKAWSAFFGGWNRMSAAKRSEALRELAEQGLPKGFALTRPEDRNPTSTRGAAADE